MNNIYWILAGILVLVIAFRLYLLATGQYIWTHTIKDDKKHLWREGRHYFHLGYRDETRSYKYYPSPRVHVWWYLFHLSPIGIKLYYAGDEFDVQVYLSFLVGRVGFEIGGTAFLRWLLKRLYRMGWGYGAGAELSFLDRTLPSLTFYWHYNDMASGPSPRIRVPAWKWLYDYKRRRILGRRWKRHEKLLNLRVLRNDRKRGYLEIDPLPRGVHLWPSVDYMRDSMPTGGGWRFSIDFDYIILGSYERDVETIGEPVVMDIPIEPDNRLGLRYSARFQRYREIRWRGHFPWRKRIQLLWEVESDNPPLHSGKGENSWDQDDDGIFGCSVIADTIEGAVAEYVAKCHRDRKRYGLPGVIYQLQKGAR